MTEAGEVGRLVLAAERIRRVLAVGALALLGVTWRLWTPQNLFPRVPALEWITSWPQGAIDAVDWVTLGLCTAALTFLAMGKSGGMAKAAAMAVAVTLLILVLMDQHRLQPWAVHIALGLLFAEFAHPTRRIDYLRWFTASIYVYSALGKFDAQFLYTVGQDFIGTLLSQLGWDIRLLPNPARYWLAASLPITELLVGGGLVFRRTQRVAAVAAMIMHLLLLSALGPWGLRHAWGVLAWNLLFIAMDLFLYLWPVHDRSTSKAETGPPLPVRWGWVEGLILVAMIAPLGERLGVVDHWLGWALYAPHSSRVRIEVAAGAVPRLPSVVQPFVEAGDEFELIWREVRIDRWSLATLGAPVYPQQRFQLGVARALADKIDERDIRVHLLSTADRWSGRRSERTLEGRREVNAAAAEYWLNTKPLPIE